MHTHKPLAEHPEVLKEVTVHLRRGEAVDLNLEDTSACLPPGFIGFLIPFIIGGSIAWWRTASRILGAIEDIALWNCKRNSPGLNVGNLTFRLEAIER